MQHWRRAPQENDMATAVNRKRPAWKAYVSIARFDHWVKNVFVLPGIVFGAIEVSDWSSLFLRVVAGGVSVGLIASSNYIINEIMDAASDRFHPVKRLRPIPSGLVSVPVAYLEWIAFMIVGMALALTISRAFAATMAFLWLMGICYNIRPLRTKDVPYLDVLSESINNPIRMLAGWYITLTPKMPPGSLLASYWMVGAYFMAVKRFAEYREIGDPAISAAYRRSFAYYNEQRLLVSLMFYASAAMLFFGAFVARYRLELILGFPLVALVMAIYLKLAFEPNSAVQNPEYLYRQRGLMVAVALCAAVLACLLFVDMPVLYRLLSTQYSGYRPQVH
jgi:decaprenyl-phosphate phosphoribosyltransferase